MGRIRVFVGHFGSGKTEIAINTALKLAKEGKKVILADLDIVNPYFCVRELKEELEEQGVRVVSSNPEYINAELMVVPPEVKTIFNDPSYEVVMDVGGDDMGAIALGQYNSYFRNRDHEVKFVINTNRPFTDSEKGIEEYISRIESSARLKVTSLISNTNLSYETTADDIIKGDKVVSQLSKKIGLPHEFTACREDFTDEVKDKVEGDLFPIKIQMQPRWLELNLK